MEDDEDEVIQDEAKSFEYGRGKKIQIAPYEEQAFKDLSRKQRRHLQKQFDRKIKSGELVPVEYEGETRYITRLEALAKGVIK
jgi:hypothetical protein